MPDRTGEARDLVRELEASHRRYFDIEVDENGDVWRVRITRDGEILIERHMVRLDGSSPRPRP